MELTLAIQTRRTHKQFAGSAVSRADLEHLLDMAIKAPNHRRNEPWHFIVVEKPQLLALWDQFVSHADQIFSAATAAWREKKQSKLANLFAGAGALIFILSAKNSDAFVERENYAATCCATQNLMLAATQRGLGTFWSTGNLFMTENSAALIGYSAATHAMVGAIFIGKPLGSPPAPNFHLDSKVHYWQPTQA